MQVEFKTLDVIIARPGSSPLEETARVLVCWEILPVYTGLDGVRFTIERSLSPVFPAEDTETISGVISGVPGLSVYEYLDITASLINTWRQYFYRVRAGGAGSGVSRSATWEKVPRVYELAIIERQDLLLEEFTGTPCYAFIERTVGAAMCPLCFDVVAQRPTKSNCHACLSTGRQRPYLSPIFLYADMNPAAKVVQIAALGEVQPKQRTAWFSAYPILKPGDLVYECGSGVFHRINRLGPNSQPQGVTVMQVALLDAVDPNTIIYSVLPNELPEDELRSTMAAWQARRDQRFF